MELDEILSKYSLTRDTAAQYIDAITRMNQTQAANQLDVSRDTINRYKKAFSKMDAQERLQLISSLAHDKLLQHTTNQS
jgi:DNA-binding XRE family transcriptional regulator